MGLRGVYRTCRRCPSRTQRRTTSGVTPSACATRFTVMSNASSYVSISVTIVSRLVYSVTSYAEVASQATGGAYYASMSSAPPTSIPGGPVYNKRKKPKKGRKGGKKDK